MQSMCCGCVSRCLSRCCASLIRFSARWSNYIIFLCGLAVTLLGLRIASIERNMLCLLVLLLGVLTMLTAYFGIWLAGQPERRPCCVTLYSLLLLLLLIPQLAGAALVKRESFVDSMVSQSCSQFDAVLQSKLHLARASNFSAPPSAQPCPNQETCSASDGCLCECDDKCRSCQRDVQRSRDFVREHAQLSSRVFLGFGALELFAWLSVQLLSRFDLNDGEGSVGTEMEDRARKPSAGEQNSLLRAMKEKYGDHSHENDPLAGVGLLGADDQDEIFCI